MNNSCTRCSMCLPTMELASQKLCSICETLNPQTQDRADKLQNSGFHCHIFCNNGSLVFAYTFGCFCVLIDNCSKVNSRRSGPGAHPERHTASILRGRNGYACLQYAYVWFGMTSHDVYCGDLGLLQVLDADARIFLYHHFLSDGKLSYIL